MSATISLKGKVAIVTGGGRGIGKAIVRNLAEAGAAVAIASRKLENLQATATEFAGLPGKILPVECHVGKADQLANLVRETEKQLGPVDILVNNSATNIGQGPSLDITDEMLDKMVEINKSAALHSPYQISSGRAADQSIASIAGPNRRPAVPLTSQGRPIAMTRGWAAVWADGRAHRPVRGAWKNEAAIG